MHHLVVKGLLINMLIFLLPSKSICQLPSDSLLIILKADIGKKTLYDSNKEKSINKLKFLQSHVVESDIPGRYHIASKLYDEYKDYKFDSAFIYAQKLLQIGKKTNDLKRQYESLIHLGSIQLSGGMFKETFDCLGQINIHLANDSLRLKYFSLKARALLDLAAYNRSAFFSPAQQALSKSVLDSAILLTKRGSYDYYKKIAEKLALNGKKSEATSILKRLLNNTRTTEHQKAMAANDLSHLTNGREKDYLVTLAAIYDIRSSTKQTLAIFTLGKSFFIAGKLEEAILFLQEALAQARFYGNRPREREIIAVLTQAQAQKLINSENHKNHILTVLIFAAVLVLTTLSVVSYIVHSRLKKVKLREQLVQERNQHLDDINKKLIEDGHIKEEYIGYFFDVISGYISKIEKIKRNTERKLKGKNYEELMQLAKEIDIKLERENLFYTFDSVFLKLFPNFITIFNSMLKKEDQIWPKHNELLNTNLRIYALMRLGIKDTQTIANILETAVSTIYTYKNRIKSKALVQGNEFDLQIMNIKFIE